MTHGFTRQTASLKKWGTYRAWLNMKKRCYDPKCDKFKYYGGRGIRVCKSWKDNFLRFVSDMGLRPTNKHSIDRKNNNADYYPSNCQWSTQVNQGRNRRNNRIICVNGNSKCVSEWSEETGLNQSTILSRLNRNQDPIAPLTRHPANVTINGETKHVREWAKLYDITPQMIYKRINRGWPNNRLLDASTKA